VAAEGEIIKPPEETPFNLRIVGERVHLSSGKLTNVSSRDNMADNMSNSVVEENVNISSEGLLNNLAKLQLGMVW
jgi:hypothetical protein